MPPPRRPSKKELPATLATIAAAHPEAIRIELWFQDEMRVGQKGTLTRVWGLRGQRAVRRRDLRFSSAYLFGAVCPERGVGAALVLPRVSLWATNQHLAEISKHITPGAHAALVLDGAGWHSAPGLIVPANITLVVLPPYSPELNPAEALWHEMRRRFFALQVFADYDAIVEACCAAWNRVQADPAFIRSVTGYAWLPSLNA